ncbi:MAG: archaemetzincin family Zn-dependent metalloprotease [bacterium]
MPYISVNLIGLVKISELSSILKELEDLFLFPFRMEKRFDYPLYAYEPKRNQYYAYKIIKNLLNECSDDVIKFVGITDIDLCTPVLEFIFGEAQFNGKVALISSHRLRQEFYHLSPDINLLLVRLKKVLAHELGHCFGMVHCDDGSCVMYLSNNIFTLDNKKSHFCPRCGDFIKEKVKKEYYGKA